MKEDTQTTQQDNLKRIEQLEQEVHDLRGMIMELRARKVKEGDDF